MKKIIVLILFLTFATSCKAQKEDLNLQWREFESKEAGMKASLPCEPTKKFKSFQDEPRPIHVYDFSCEVEGIKFLISSKNHLNEFDDKTIGQVFNSNESNLKFIFGAVESFNEKKDFLTSGFNSKYYDVTLKSGGIVNMLAVVNEKRSYQAIFFLTPEGAGKFVSSKTDFGSISKRFIDSFQVIEK